MDPSNKVLFFDKQSSLRETLSLTAASMGLLLENIDNADYVKERIKVGRVGTLIVRGSFSPTAAKSLALWCKAELGSKLRVALLFDEALSADEFCELHRDHKIDLVLEGPLTSDDVRGILFCLTKQSKEAAEEETDIIADLRRIYDEGFYDKVILLERRVEALELTASEALAERLQEEIHKIAGSAGSYGYWDISSLCRNLHLEILNRLKGRGSFDAPWIASLREFLVQFRKAFQLADAKSALGQPKGAVTPFWKGSAPPTKVDLYLVSSDQIFLESIRRHSISADLSLETDSSPDRAAQKLLDPNFLPQMLIVDQHFLNGESGLELVQKFSAHRGRMTAQVGLLIERDHPGDTQEAARYGVNIFFSKKGNPQDLIEVAKSVAVKSRGKRFRVLFVEDDTDMGSIGSAYLQEIGIEVEVLPDARHLIEQLQEDEPDLLLLDLQLPGISGLEVLAKIRREPLFQRLPIMVITAGRDADKIEEAYLCGVDDFVMKPLMKRVFQNRVQKFLHRQQALSAMRDRDALTSLLNRKSFSEVFENALSKNFRGSREMCLAVVGLQGSGGKTGLGSRTVPDEVLVRFSGYLSKAIRPEDAVARWTTEEFAILLNDMPLEMARRTMEDTLKALQKEPGFMELAEAIPHFHCGIASCPRHGKSLLEVSQEVSRVLGIARAKGKNVVLTA